jgi:hypothetical protein
MSISQEQEPVKEPKEVVEVADVEVEDEEDDEVEVEVDDDSPPS